MATSPDFNAYILDHFEKILRVKTKRLFSGTGLYYGAVMFGAILDNTLYFVVDDTTRQKYIDAGMKPFSYTKKKGNVTIKRFYELPEDVMTDENELRQWSQEAITVARQKQTKPR